MDSHLGNAETYLADDVPAWAKANLQIDLSHLAVGGFSFGGTCALQLALRRPDVYPTFLDISGQAQPTLGDHTQTVQQAFGGDEAAFDRSDPLHELVTTRYPGTAGVFAAGRDDGTTALRPSNSLPPPAPPTSRSRCMYSPAAIPGPSPPTASPTPCPGSAHARTSSIPPHPPPDELDPSAPGSVRPTAPRGRRSGGADRLPRACYHDTGTQSR
jgi:pimeloyl-ACP methyl ester carboxylesterase